LIVADGHADCRAFSSDVPFTLNGMLDGLRITVGTDAEIDRLSEVLKTLI